MLSLESGIGELEARLEKRERKSASGRLDLVADDVILKRDEIPLQGDLEVHASLTEGDLATGTFDVSGTTIRLDDIAQSGSSEKQQGKLEPWYGHVEIEEGILTFGSPMTMNGHVRMAMEDTRPVLIVLRKFTNEMKWLNVTRNVKQLDGTMDLGFGAGDLVQVPVVIADPPRRPSAAAVGGFVVGPVGANGNSAVHVRKPDIEKRRLVFGRPVHQLPGRAPIGGAQDRRVVPDSPSEVAIMEENRGEHGSRRRFLLLPAFTAVSRDQDVAALSDRDHRIIDDDRVECQRFRREACHDGRLGLGVLQQLLESVSSCRVDSVAAGAVLGRGLVPDVCGEGRLPRGSGRR